MAEIHVKIGEKVCPECLGWKRLRDVLTMNIPIIKAVDDVLTMFDLDCCTECNGTGKVPIYT